MKKEVSYLSTMPAQLKTLTSLNTQDFLASFGLENLRHGRWLFEALSAFPALKFARQIVAFDQMVEGKGLQEASRQTLKQMRLQIEFNGLENLPPSGPLIILSNHPGLADTLLLFASLSRPDLRIIAAHRPFLQALPHTNRYLIYVSEDTSQRMVVLRKAVNHLRAGGSILTFPAGKIEPDPATMPGALQSLLDWSDSIALLARLAPQALVVPALVSGVIWPGALRNPLSRLRKAKEDRERLAAALQLLVQTLFPAYQPIVARVSYGKPVSAASLARLREAPAILAAATEPLRRMIESINQPARQISSVGAGSLTRPV